MNTEKIKEVFADKAFVKSLVGLESAAEVQSALKEKGVEISDKEAFALYDLRTKIKNGEITKEQIEKLQLQAENGELSDEELEMVAGGWGVFAFIGIVSLLIIATSICIVVADG